MLLKRTDWQALQRKRDGASKPVQLKLSLSARDQHRAQQTDCRPDNHKANWCDGDAIY